MSLYRHLIVKQFIWATNAMTEIFEDRSLWKYNYIRTIILSCKLFYQITFFSVKVRFSDHNTSDAYRKRRHTQKKGKGTPKINFACMTVSPVVALRKGTHLQMKNSYFPFKLFPISYPWCINLSIVSLLNVQQFPRG